MKQRNFVWAAIVLGVVLRSVAMGEDLPRYKLQPGEVLNYAYTETIEGKDGKPHTSRGSVQLVVGAERGNGWDIIECNLGEKAATQPSDSSGSAQRVGTLHPDGHLELPENSEIRGTALLPNLPASEKETTDGYHIVGTSVGDSEVYKVRSHSGNTWLIDSVNDAPELAFNSISESTSYTFDSGKGLLTHNSQQFMQARGSQRKSTVTSDLIGTGQDLELAQRLGADADVLQQAMAIRADAFKNFHGDEIAMNQQMDQALGAMKLLRSQLKMVEFQRKLDESVATTEKYKSMEVKELLAEHAQTASVLDHPAPEGSWEKVGGGRVSLQELRGKVVVMDFWYRGCGWCIKAMPQVKAFERAERGNGVVVFGMNVDQKVGDAQFVIDHMQLPYAVLRTTFADAKKYGVNGYPTVIVIDRQGVVRKIFDGYSPTLGQELEAVVKPLLN